MKPIINTYHVNDRTFTIVYHQKHYCAIEDKYIDKDGKLTQELNGLQLFASMELNECLERVKKQTEIDKLVNDGMEKAEAIWRVMDIPLSLEAWLAINGN